MDFYSISISLFIKLFLKQISQSVMQKTFFISFIISISLTAQSQNLIINPSFEQNGLPYCKGWYDSCGNEFVQQCDSMNYCGTIIINKAAPDSTGGKWCLEVFGSFPTSGYADTYITGQAGTKVYQLKFWLDTEHFVGQVYMGPMKNRTFVDSNAFIVYGQPWAQYSLLDTITTNITDTIGVRLSATIGDFCLCDVEYDQVELTIIDSLSTAVISPQSYPLQKIYPNPFTDKFTIQVPGYSGFNVTIFDITGKVIQQVNSNNDFINVNMSDALSNIYFYQITSGEQNLMIGHGKLAKVNCSQ